MTKQRTKCGDVKGAGEFHKHKASKDGLLGKCKACAKEYSNNTTKTTARR